MYYGAADSCTCHGSHLIPYPQYAIRHTLYEFIYVFAITFLLKPYKLINGPNNFTYLRVQHSVKTLIDGKSFKQISHCFTP